MFVDDLFISTAQGTYYSSSVSMAGGNSAMFEFVVSAAHNIATTDGVAVALEGSNDGNNWDDDIGLDSGSSDTSAVPFYYAIKDVDLVIPYSMIRLRFTVTASDANPAHALVSASIRVWSR